MRKIANRLPDQEHIAAQACPEARILHGNQLDAVAGGCGRLPAVQAVRETVRITDGTSNTIFFG
jgi:hypothetical protein